MRGARSSKGAGCWGDNVSEVSRPFRALGQGEVWYLTQGGAR